ncbi:YesL family protein [Gracilibacillus dipsosauri]|uniref:YesL family protein n=1 Tax=Gracilibacillus dipsosauri TaxID=178340 RepID=UPI002409184A
MYKLMEWTAKISLMNIMWILLTLAGFILFGFFPATVALLMVCRDLTQNNNKVVWSSFLTYFVENFIKANGYGYFVTTLNVCFISLAIHSLNNWSMVIRVPVLVIAVLTFIVSLYVLPVFSYFKGTFINHLKLSVFIALGHPVVSFVLFSLFVLNFSVIFYSNILIVFPALFLFFMVSVSAYLTMIVLKPVFNKFSYSKDKSIFPVKKVSGSNG